MNIRKAQISDLFQVQECNLVNLPENYIMKYFNYHLLTWPEISFVAETEEGKIVGYVLCKMEEEDAADVHGHITSLSVLRPYRRLKIAEELMKQAEYAFAAVYKAKYISLHVRVSNTAAFCLYKDCLKFRIHNIDKGYYADKEDAYSMRKDLPVIDT